ncbi:MAG TPA: hydrogenase [Acidiphilium sp.]|nr:MAG: hydrogenase [Acidiphilium sp. 21-60-14]OYV90650.1 MAG: hydrogenase [Acidiphilium sp. 37-60-79]OZB38558.1 MAG: hydrogenase [Acidiphilium sp. 34-60-192]HQT88144.1 hydrogenase [Acidiphilium sp.]HQU24236.1 hydrogenase [Acidiphilium sp.]
MKIPHPDPTIGAALAQRLAAEGRVRPTGGLAIRHIDAGSCGGCELELRSVRAWQAGLAAYGIRFVDDPRTADILLVTGVATQGMAEPLRRTLAAMAGAKLVVVMGDCAVDGGVFKDSPAVLGGVARLIAVDLALTGCPPAPEQVINGLLAALAS